MLRRPYCVVWQTGLVVEPNWVTSAASSPSKGEQWQPRVRRDKPRYTPSGDIKWQRFVLPVVSTCLYSRGNSEEIHSLILTPLVLMHFRDRRRRSNLLAYQTDAR